ncbi:hypothetical protein SCLCIDRAFT_139545 [Scleroderma citrinum Foug A]|uniref:Peptidase A1 domain-containing protein n=1 Tax=Scleroderma citrinum Foug A TaxID=1036808 RepID=A0A0C2ZKI6_9AGAM|nr:hypothetical protein SCLCIDRAFT_139545 [Scleroderma citrinum Foug A]
MFLSKVLFLLFFLAGISSVYASPFRGRITLGVAAKVKARGIINIAEADRARAKALREGRLNKRDAIVGITNSQAIYTAKVGVGSPPTEYTLLVDTGSSNTWVGANQPYVSTNTSHATGNTVSISYGSGSFHGNEYMDTITFGNALTISQQSIGIATQSDGLEGTGIDGILGLGPKDLTQGTTSNTSLVPTVIDNLYAEGQIKSAVLGVYFTPASASNVGELTFGGYDPSVLTSAMKYASITKTHPASTFWGIDQDVSYGGATVLSGAGIVDTGTTLILIATDAFQTYQAATGGVLDKTTGLLSITQLQYDNLKTLSVRIGESTYDLTPNAQIWPRSLNSAIGGRSDSIYLIVSDIGTPSGSGMDFVNGYTFLERFYSVYDTTDSLVGFATTDYTASTGN